MVIRLSVGDFTVCGRRERVAPPLRGAKRIDNLRFSILLGLQLSLICQSGADHRPASASKSGNDSRVTLVFILRDIRSSQITFCCTYGLLTLCRTLRRAADLCSSPISGTAKRLRKTRKEKSSAAPLRVSALQISPCPLREKGRFTRGWKTAGCLPSCAPAARSRSVLAARRRRHSSLRFSEKHPAR